ncbi:putative disease resistance protein RGA4 [Ananas comosus]|uniref:Putative disease resistance protein RGA4 n=1 Tax=Ananas comosus TaxID=4615 RepID=A0A199ULU7_ANACO|nr:putative disease resistance protein RGA4 [Ananas comosus]
MKAPKTMKAALERINQALPQIHAILSIVERGQICEQNKALNAWLWQLRDAVEEAEDVLDELKYYELEKKANAHDDKVSGSVFEPKRKLFTFHNHSFSDDTLKRLREAVKGLDKVAANVGPFLQLVTGLHGNGVKLQQLDEIKNARETSSFVIENCVLGREKEKKMIVEWLTRPVGDKPEPSAAANVSALAIVGIGGLGKTTLAQLIYHDESVQKYFDALMWVCVSDCINAAMLTRKILEASKIGKNFGDKSPMLTRKSLEASKIGKNFGDSLNTLQEVLKEHLAKKKFLLILDDVWNDDKENEWEKVVAPLKCGQRGSKILLTTRMNSVADMIAKATKGENEIFKLDGLEENSNLLLFKKHAFAGVNPDDHKSLLLIGKKIAKKLMGCPLAAKVIGGLLNSFMDVGYWIRILKKDIENIEQDEDGIMTLLRLSYQHLPTNLQICFRYCCIFPKDYQFKKDELIYMWLGSGLIQNSRHGERPEDIAGMNLENVRNTKEAIEAKLNEKENLALLSLAWTSGHSTDLQMDEQLFDILRPHINLKKLKVDGYGGTRSPYWMANLSLSNLRSIELFNCHRWQQLPPVDRLPLLNYLHLNGMQAIKQVEFSINESGVACAFPSLKEIRFVDMLEWEEWVGIENRYLFPQLQTLEIRNCPKLRGLPTLPISLRRLAINNVGFAALPQIRQDCSNSSRRASLLEPSLYSLTINNCQNLTSLNEWLLQQQQHIKALEELSIQGCRKLVHLPVEMFAELLYLKKLTIKDCEQLVTSGAPRQ